MTEIARPTKPEYVLFSFLWKKHADLWPEGWAVVASAAVNVRLQESACVFFSAFEDIPGSGIAGSCGNFVLNFLGNCSFPFFKRHVFRLFLFRE